MKQVSGRIRNGQKKSTTMQHDKMLAGQFYCFCLCSLRLSEKQPAGDVSADETRLVQRGFPDFCTGEPVNSQYCDLRRY